MISLEEWQMKIYEEIEPLEGNHDKLWSKLNSLLKSFHAETIASCDKKLSRIKDIIDKMDRTDWGEGEPYEEELVMYEFSEENYKKLQALLKPREEAKKLRAKGEKFLSTGGEEKEKTCFNCTKRDTLCSDFKIHGSCEYWSDDKDFSYEDKASVSEEKGR